MSLFLFLLACRAAYFQPQQWFKTSLMSFQVCPYQNFLAGTLLGINQIMKIPKICLVQLSCNITRGLFPYLKAFFSLNLNISLDMCCVSLKPESLCTLLLGSLFVTTKFYQSRGILIEFRIFTKKGKAIIHFGKCKSIIETAQSVKLHVHLNETLKIHGEPTLAT